MPGDEAGEVSEGHPEGFVHIIRHLNNVLSSLVGVLFRTCEI